jgi:holo-[acyl-carrier protein] synthase
MRALRSAWQQSVELIDQTARAGIDLVEVEPLRQLVEAGGETFVDATWTAREQRDANGQAEGLAGKWAAKEAVMKVLQRGIGDLDPRDVEIVTEPSGAPRVELHRAARTIAKQHRIASWYVSLTHEGGWAAAIVIASSLRTTIAETAVARHEGRNHD